MNKAKKQTGVYPLGAGGTGGRDIGDVGSTLSSCRVGREGDDGGLEVATST